MHHFPYAGFEPVEVPDKNLIPVGRPDRRGSPEAVRVLEDALSAPEGTERLRSLAKGRRSALVLVDDATRPTPAHLMAPLVVEELMRGGLREEQIAFLCAGGSHRSMTEEEKVRKVGEDIAARFKVHDHEWDKEGVLVGLGRTEDGVDVVVNRLAREADLLVGLGQVCPHRVSGFSGGSKIVLPGICGQRTVGQTHWLSTYYPIEEIFGVRDNPVRKRMDDVARVVGLDFVLNVVMDEEGRVMGAVAGDFVAAHRKAARLAMEVNVVYLPRRADIVIADSRPCDRDFWQASKALASCSLSVRPGGDVIIATPCAEGIATDHPQVEEHGYSSAEEVTREVEGGRFEDLTGAAHICHTRRVLDHAHCVLVSPGIGAERGARAKLPVVVSAGEAVREAFRRQGDDASVLILEHCADTFPIVDSRPQR